MGCLNALFRATVDVSGVVKKGQVDLVSNIPQQYLSHTPVLGQYILFVVSSLK